jgi:tetratricopeptide (TPR) repeat protein
MKPLHLRLMAISALSVLFAGAAFASTDFSVASSVQGTVYDKQRNPLSDVDVEILNDYYQSLNRTKTDSTGRYFFGGLSDGRFTIRVLAFRYDLVDQDIPIEIQTMTVRGTEGVSMVVQDFFLLPRRGSLKESELGVVFAQEVPKVARESYEQALKDFSSKRDTEGFEGLKKALELFPGYYNALHRFGIELFMRKQYLESAGAFVKAVEVNPKSATSFYYLGYDLYNLGEKYNKAARTSTKEALTMAPGSLQVLMLMGKIERRDGNFTAAETHYLLAKKLSSAKVPEIHKELAQLYANDMKKYDEAAAELELYLKASSATGEDEKKTRKLIAELRAKPKASN